MRKPAPAFAVAVLVLCSTTLAGQGHQATDTDAEAPLPATPDATSDAEIAARVRAALIDDETAALLEDEAPTERVIDVESHAGIVRLRGIVESEDSKRSVEQAAASVAGVKGVRNELTVHESGGAIGTVVQDAVIAAKIKEQLADSADVEAAGTLTVEVRNGVVQLSGAVDSVEEMHRAASTAGEVDGVREVKNDIRVQPR